ncbi:MAG: LL-diaminopimelate aminotransferase [Phycisphaerales bacterium]|nr:MAG: LL-diaminopimelate aminotransferase [Phycisphaerales bacterium]
MRRAERLERIPPYLAFEIDRQKREAIAAGVDVIDLGVGDPDQPTPAFVVEAMERSIRDPKNHTYSLGAGVREYRQAAADSVARRFGVRLDPVTELTPLIGAKDAIAHLPLAFVDPGDNVLVPDPGYPAYVSGCILAGGVAYAMPLDGANDWLPRLDEIPDDVARAARILYLNYPNNPTGAVAPLAFLEEAVAFARKHGILLVHDAPYIDNYFDEPAPSVLQAAGAMECAIELHSLSKSFNMTGWRIGFAVGNPDAIRGLAFVKSNVDSGPFKAVQWAACEALRDTSGEHTEAMRNLYRRRRDVLVCGLEEIGLGVTRPRGAFYVWVRCPEGVDSLPFCERLLSGAGVTVCPGVGFGAAGEGYFRISLTVPEDRLREAVERMRKVL